MKSDALRNMTDDQLAQAESNAVEDLFRQRFQHHTGQLSNTGTLKETRKTIARIKTLISERTAAKESSDE